MALTGAPTWAEREIITSDKLNTLTTVLVSKFNGGISASDMVWPMVAQGNIDLADYALLNVPRFWDVYNINERTGTVQDLYNDIDTAGGGVVIVPPNTTVAVSTLDVGSNTITVGCGWTSVLQASVSPSRHFLIQNKAAGDSGIRFLNLKLDGSVLGGFSGAIKFQQAFDCAVDDVFFSTFNGSASDYAAINLGNDGTVGHASMNISVRRCFFQSNASLPSIRLEDIASAFIEDCRFDANTLGAIRATPTNANQIVQNINIVRPYFEATSSNAAPFMVFDRSSVAAASNNCRGVLIVGADMNGAAADTGMLLDVNYWDKCDIKHSFAHDSTTIDPCIRYRNSIGFTIDDVDFDSLGGDGICIGSEGYGTAYASRTDAPCSRFKVLNCNFNDIDFAGLIINGDGFSAIGNHFNDVSQATDATYSAIELWYASATRDYKGSVISGNTAYDDATGNDQYQGLNTWDGVAGDDGSHTSEGAHIGGTSVSNIIVSSNLIPGADTGGAGTDFVTSGTNNTIFVDNIL